MTTPLKSILITSWSPQQLTGHDLDGGSIVSYNLDTAMAGTEALGHDQSRWNVGDIATIRIAADTNLAELRIVTDKKSILRVREFQIFDITHTVADDQNRKDHGRHIFMEGTSESGATYVMPMLGYTAWTNPWDLSSLQNALMRAQNHSAETDGAAPALTHENTTQKVMATDAPFATALARYKNIFYTDCNAETPFENVASLTTTAFTMRQSGPTTIAYMYVAAFIKKTNFLPLRGIDETALTKKGIAFSPPYFKIDGEKVFIRTNSTVAST